MKNENRFDDDPPALDFLLCLLHQDPMARPTASQALLHHWFALILEEHDILALSYPPAPSQMVAVTRSIKAAGPADAVPASSQQLPQTMADVENPDLPDTVSEVTDMHGVVTDADDDEDYVDEPTGVAQKNGKRRRKVGLREIYQQQRRHRIAMAKAFRTRRRKQGERKETVATTSTEASSGTSSLK